MATIESVQSQSADCIKGACRAGAIKSFSRHSILINSANTDVCVFSGLPAKWRLRKLTISNASGTPVLGSLALYSASGAGGTALVAADTLTTLTTSAKAKDMTVASSDVMTTAAYLRNVAANAAAVTVSVRLEIEDLS